MDKKELPLYTRIVYSIANIEYKVASAKCRFMLDDSNNPEFLKLLKEAREMLGNLLGELVQPANTNDEVVIDEKNK